MKLQSHPQLLEAALVERCRWSEVWQDEAKVYWLWKSAVHGWVCLNVKEHVGVSMVVE